MKKMLGGQKFSSDTEVQSVVSQWLGQQPASFFASGIQKLVDRWDKCLNERSNINLLSLFILFSFLCCLSLVSYDRQEAQLLLGKPTVRCYF